MIPPPSSSHKFAAYPPNALDQPQDPPELPKSVDKSEGLFSMYLDRSDEDDRKVTENWKGETDAMLIFVSPSSVTTFAIESLIFLNTHYRLAFSQLLSPLFFQFQYKTFNQIRRTPQPSTSQIFTFSSPTQPALSPPPFLSQQTHLNFRHRHTQFWSTHFGS